MSKALSEASPGHVQSPVQGLAPDMSKASPGHVQGKGGVKGGKAYCILGFRVPTTSVGARGEGAKGSEGGEGE